MPAHLTKRLRILWVRKTRLDVFFLALLAVCAGLWLPRAFVSISVPRAVPSLVLIILMVVALGYFSVRGVIWARRHLLWSLRNRLGIAYLFIAVVPVLLLLTMAGLAAYLLYWQLGSYVLFTEMQNRVERVANVAGTMATSYAIEASSGRRVAALAIPEDTPTYLKAAMTELPGLKIETGKGEEFLRSADGSLQESFAGLVLKGQTLALRAVVVRPTIAGRVLVSATVPVTPELIGTLAPELGPLRFDVLRPAKSVSLRDVPVVINRQRYTRFEQIGTQGRSIPRAVNLFDKLVTGVVGLEVLDQDRKSPDEPPARLFASFSTRPSLLNRRLFSPLGELGGIAVTALLVVGAIFLLLEFGALLTGIILTRTITTAVDDLYLATQHVQRGDLSYRVGVRQQDQLGALGNSFNSMMQSVSTLIEVQGQRQRLENELSIAREVQQQLFPHALPQVPGVELEAICRAARIVSGDYYDFIRLGPERLAIALADISGKGISAALLMASVQAALRSDVLRHRGEQLGSNQSQINTAEIISHLNRHLFRNTSDERYATCFFAVYDARERRLTYTNAGHLPPLYISGDRVQKLEAGGMVVGLFNDVPFEQGTLEIESGGLLLAYSDGLIEPENSLGEEFGTERLIEVVLRNRSASPHIIAESMMRAAQAWSGTPEQADDMTVIVARLSPPETARSLSGLVATGAQI